MRIQPILTVIVVWGLSLALVPESAQAEICVRDPLGFETCRPVSPSSYHQSQQRSQSEVCVQDTQGVIVCGYPAHPTSRPPYSYPVTSPVIIRSGVQVCRRKIDGTSYCSGPALGIYYPGGYLP